MPAVLKYGSSGSDVRKMTTLLKAVGYLQKATTQFDAVVRKAVKAFQAHHVDPRGVPLAVDGIVGPLTWWALKGDRPDVEPSLSGSIPSGGSRIGRAALRAAMAEAEKGAREVGSNNHGPWVEKYLNGLAPEGNSWCAGFVSWCFDQAPGAMPYNYSLGARDVRNQFRHKGWTYDLGEEEPAPGDIVVWWRGTFNGWQGHIGFVHHCADGILHTVEGNRGPYPSPVQSYTYVLSRMEKLLGFGRVP